MFPYLELNVWLHLSEFNHLEYWKFSSLANFALAVFSINDLGEGVWLQAPQHQVLHEHENGSEVTLFECPG